MVLDQVENVIEVLFHKNKLFYEVFVFKAKKVVEAVEGFVKDVEFVIGIY